MPRSTPCHAGTTRRWWDGPPSSPTSSAHVERAAAGRCEAVLLAGDAGVGKTRLLDELTARAADRGVRVLTGHCVDLGDVGLPYLPFVDLLRPVAGDPELAPDAAANPVARRPLRRTSGGLPAGAAGARGAATSAARCRTGPRRSRSRTDGSSCSSRCRAHLRAGVCRPAADRARGHALGRPVQPRPAALPPGPAGPTSRWPWVASYRADDLHRRHPLRPLLAELVRLPGVERLELSPLPDAEVGALVRRLAARPARCPSPRSRTSSPGPRATRSTRRSCSPPALHGEALPMALTDVLLARVEQRSPAAQQVLRVAAVAGRRVRHELVAAVGGLADGDSRRRWPRRCTTTCWWSPTTVATGSGTPCCARPWWPTCCRGSGSGCTRAIAAYLAGAPGAATAAERAHHARESNDLPGAFTRVAGGGGRGLRRRAPPPSSCSTWRRRSRSGRPCPTRRIGPGGVRRPCCWRRPRPRARWGSCTAPSPCCARRWRCSGDADPEARARVHYTLAQAMVRVEDDAGAYRESAAAMALVPAQPPSKVRTWAAATHARMAYSFGRMDEEADAAAEEALAAADALGSTAPGPTSRSRRCAPTGADPAVVQARLDEALTRARRSGNVEVEMRVLLQPRDGRLRGGPHRGGAGLDPARHAARPRPRRRVVVLPGGAAAPARHGAVHGRRLGRQPGRGRRAGPRARDGRRTCGPTGCWCWSAGATRPRTSASTGRGG